MKLQNIEVITGKIILQTGLHIGAGDAEIQIGGIDSPVMKHPETREPYIPGSSLKGKIRSLLEWKSGCVKEKPLSLADLENASNKEAVKRILQLFGVSGDSKNHDLGATRLAFWDCHLNQEYAQKLKDKNLLPTEDKAENVINRISGTAEHPRHIERVIAGAMFDFKVSIKQFDTDNGNELTQELLKGLKLLEMDSLGGSGSRGYGKVKFELDGGLTLPENPFV
ncbi:MAG: type III-A CRISPR-associated RAMP protein Csm3 [Neisseriaceae bacterium]|nr:type III-A CRISPR-associated RAMP protein Csm3 [Neisseriaceae bacterium]